ncbi:MAG: GHKL domain-containing protein [Alteromonadaceae bacterium]|nr:GHKL domain-containing protein [Alteromonadaceae bacterium]
MRRASLKIRIFSAALLALLFFVPLMSYALKQAFVASLTSAQEGRMQLQLLTLISEFDVVDQEYLMPEMMINGDLNLPESGLYGVIHNPDLLVWKSMSAINWQVPEIDEFPVPGGSKFATVKVQKAEYFQYTYTAEYETTIGFTPVAFHIFQEKSGFNAEVTRFEKTLLRWLGIISALLFLLLLFSLNTALSPIKRLIAEIRGIEEGNKQSITQQYPTELETLKVNLNHLLTTEANQRERYKNSLGDLAHSLKTPLAVLAGMPELPAEGKEPVAQIDNIIQRQLKRAVAGTGSGWNQKEPVAPIVEKLTLAMEKVYAGKELTIEYELQDDASFYGDSTDLMELLGNLMDNACKAAKSSVLITTMQSDTSVSIWVEDDGKGIPHDKRQVLLERGKRLDSYESGQGIGMSVVSDLISAYQGQLDIQDAGLGGAKIIVTFPIPHAETTG